MSQVSNCLFLCSVVFCLRISCTTPPKSPNLRLPIKGLLHKIDHFETYLPVGTFWGGWYVSQKVKRTYSQWNVPTGRYELFYVTGPSSDYKRVLHRSSANCWADWGSRSRRSPATTAEWKRRATTTTTTTTGTNCIKIVLPRKLILW